jgi:hypothetical protein
MLTAVLVQQRSLPPLGSARHRLRAFDVTLNANLRSLAPQPETAGQMRSSQVPRPANNHVAQRLIGGFLNGEDFSLTETVLSELEVADWVQLRTDPKRFTPAIFVGSWAKPTAHPDPSEIRILRVMTGHDGITRSIARQGQYLYAYPWM